MKNRIIISLFLLVAFYAAPVFAQEKSKDKIIAEYNETKEAIDSQSHARNYGAQYFVGKPLNLDVINKDIREFLKLISEQVKVDFFVDESVEKLPLTVKIINCPWNIALDSILNSQGLAAQKNNSMIRVAKIETLVNEGTCKSSLNRSDIPSLYTEIVRLKNIKLKENISGDSSTLDENTSKFIKCLAKLLSFRGTIEVDVRTQVVIISDTKEQIKMISDFVASLDNSELNLEEILQTFGSISE